MKLLNCQGGAALLPHSKEVCGLNPGSFCEELACPPCGSVFLPQCNDVQIAVRLTGDS